MRTIQRECECGCGGTTTKSFVPGHDHKAIMMLLRLDYGMNIVDFLHSRDYGRNRRNLYALHDEYKRSTGGS